MTNPIALMLSALLIGLGFAGGGYLAGQQFKAARLGDRTVTVKGLSEREVRADLAVWTLRFVTAGNDLAAVQNKLKRDEAATVAFLREAGIAEDTIAVQAVNVQDLQAVPYPPPNITNRFIMMETVVVRTEDVDTVAATSRQIGALIDDGVLLTEDRGPIQPTYIFNGLNDIKTEMIAEATARAREAAEQFAADSGARIGAIKRANQGVIQISPRDASPGAIESQQVDKTVRVVTTVAYYLKD